MITTISKSIEFPGFGELDVSYNKINKPILTKILNHLKQEESKKNKTIIDPEILTKVKSEAMRILQDNPMKWMLSQSKKMWVGDLRPVKLCKLSVICRGIPSSNGIHIDISGPAESGKSYLFEIENLFIDRNQVLSASAISNKALFYNEIAPGTIFYADEKEVKDKNVVQTMKSTVSSWQYVNKQNITIVEGKGVKQPSPERAIFWCTHNDESEDLPYITRWFILNMYTSEAQKERIYENQKAIYAGKRVKILSQNNFNVLVHQQIYNILFKDKTDVIVPEDLTDYASSFIDKTSRNLDMLIDLVKAYAKLNMFRKNTIFDKSGKKPKIIATKSHVDKALKVWSVSQKQMKTKLSDLNEFIFGLLKKEATDPQFNYYGFLLRTYISTELKKHPKFKDVSAMALTRSMVVLENMHAIEKSKLSDIIPIEKGSGYQGNPIAYRLITKNTDKFE